MASTFAATEISSSLPRVGGAVCAASSVAPINAAPICRPISPVMMTSPALRLLCGCLSADAKPAPLTHTQRRTRTRPSLTTRSERYSPDVTSELEDPVHNPEARDGPDAIWQHAP